MKKFITGITLIFLFALILPVAGFCEIDTEQKEELGKMINYISQAINNNEYKNIVKLISKDARPELKKEIEDNLIGKKIAYEAEISSFEEIGDSKIKVHCSFNAKGMNWSVSGFSNYFVFKDMNDHFELVDTDFHKMGSGQAKTFIWIMVGVFAVIFIPMIVFWIFMFIDLLKNDVPDGNKTLWMIIMICLNFAGAIIYFFMVKLKRNKN